MSLWSVVALLIAALSAPAQLPTQHPQSQTPIRASVEVVNVDVTVTDGSGNFVRGLKRENFRLLDNGVGQPITYFASIDSPATVLVLVETSPAVYLLHRQHLQAAQALFAGLAADDEVALATYDETARVLLPFSADKRALQAAMGGLRYNLGRAELRFYDAVTTALAWLQPIPGKKALVLLTTGLDSSGQRWEPLAERLRTSEVAAYAIALGGDLREYKESGEGPAQVSFQEADRVLKEMAEVTGGRVFFPREAKELEGIYRTIATTLRHRYSLAFAPPAHDGQFHRIHVQMLDDKGRLLGPFYSELLPPGEKPPGKGGSFPRRVRYRIFARRGYLAPAPQ